MRRTFNRIILTDMGVFLQAGILICPLRLTRYNILMVSRIQRIIGVIPQPQAAVVLPAVALRSVSSKTGKGVFASSDTLFKDAIFGRDSLEVAEDLMQSKPRLVRSILLTLARLQGTEYNEANEEEPGKIIHEYRSMTIDGRKINSKSQEILYKLSEKWGGTKEEMAYYGSVDASPHFIRVLDIYCSKNGNNILKQKILRRDGVIVEMRDVALEACEWLVGKLKTSESGLIEFMRVNPHGILNQVWKDSNEFYVHEDGKAVNHNRPISSIEVQGLAYDALLAAGRFDHENRSKYEKLAYALRDKTLELLWLVDRKYFALGTDFDKNGKLRIIRTKTANPATLLDSRFFDQLPKEIKQHYVSSIVETIFGNDFITDAGVRSRSLSGSNLVPFWDYHGSYVSWPKETYDIAKGLRRQGFKQLGHQLENRLLNIYLKNRRYPEFVYVDELGRVLSVSSGSHRHGELIVVESSNNPERVQAWTVSAIIAIMDTQLLERIKIPKRTAQTWQRTLENKLLARIPKVDLYMNPFSLAARYPTYRYQLNRPK
jgi:glycogen debranching enzyme